MIGLRSTGTSGSSDAIGGVLRFSELCCAGVLPLALTLLLLVLFTRLALVLLAALAVAAGEGGLCGSKNNS